MPKPEPTSNDETGKRLRRMSRRGFAAAAASIAGVYGGLRWLGGTETDDGLPWPLRKVLRLNESIWRGAFRPTRLSTEYPPQAGREPRVNGDYGIPGAIGARPSAEEVDAWKIEAISPRGRAEFTIADLKKLTRVDVTTELRCIEGWNTVVSWSGFRFADFAKLTGLATRSGQPLDPEGRPSDMFPYVTLATPDREYYVGLDAPSAYHPQTLMADRMNGDPLTNGHGAPIRLAIPVKYGVKNLKRIGTVRFGDDRAADFWAERGYDWYAGF